MFHRFSRYLLWEVSQLFVVTLVAFSTLIMLFVVVQQLLSQGLGPMAILQLLPYVLPMSLQFALPATLLFAVSSIYGRISADNEILSVAASGVSPMKVMAPTLVLSLLMSLFAVWMNDVACSWGQPGINRVVMRSFEQVAYSYLSSQGAYSAKGGFSIHVHGIGPDGRELIRPTITPPKSEGGETISITAKSARLKIDPDNELLCIELVDAEFNSGSAIAFKPGVFQYGIHLPKATRKETLGGRPTDYAMRQLPVEIQKQVTAIESTEQLIAARSAMGLTTGRLDWLNDTRSNSELDVILLGQSRLHRLQIETSRRWASGFSCFFFVWVGMPFSIWMRSADYWISFGTCFMPILFTYYPLFTISLGYSKDGIWPPSSLWLGNAALLLAGAWWMRKVTSR